MATPIAEQWPGMDEKPEDSPLTQGEIQATILQLLADAGDEGLTKDEVSEVGAAWATVVRLAPQVDAWRAGEVRLAVEDGELILRPVED